MAALGKLPKVRTEGSGKRCSRCPMLLSITQRGDTRNSKTTIILDSRDSLGVLRDLLTALMLQRVQNQYTVVLGFHIFINEQCGRKEGRLS